MRSRPRSRLQIRRGRITAAALAGALALVACGGSDTAGSDGDAASALPAVQVADQVEIDPAADLASNLLPDLVVDNLNDNNKVNLRNYGVGDKPILLWMWAPH